MDARSADPKAQPRRDSTGATMCASASETATYGATVAGVRGLDASQFVVVTEPCLGSALTR
jgi:hypothetical protein